MFFPVFWLCGMLHVLYIVFWLIFLTSGYSQIDGNLATMAAAMKLNGTPNDVIQYVDQAKSLLSLSFACIPT